MTKHIGCFWCVHRIGTFCEKRERNIVKSASEDATLEDIETHKNELGISCSFFGTEIKKVKVLFT